MRVVSLIASATEIVAALGARTALIGRSHECDVPESIYSLPALTRPRLDTTRNSRAIDTAVKNLVSDGLSVYDIDRDVLRDLKPDIIITQDQCEVCAASFADVESAVCDWVGQDVQIISLHPETLSDVLVDIETVGDAIERHDEAITIVSQLKDRLAELVRDKDQTNHPAPSVLVIEWIDPLMGAGHWIPELVTYAGGRNLITHAGTPSPYLTWAEIEEADPDLIVVAPCGFDLARVEKEMSAFAAAPQWQTLRAVQAGDVALVDGNRFVNRPSPAVVESAAILHDIVKRGTPQPGNTSWAWWTG